MERGAGERKGTTNERKYKKVVSPEIWIWIRNLDFPIFKICINKMEI